MGNDPRRASAHPLSGYVLASWRCVRGIEVDVMFNWNSVKRGYQI